MGVTAVADLQPGARLAEDSLELAEYTVVSCSDAHPQQVITTYDLALGRDVYTSYAAIPALAQEICDRYLEYDLYVEQPRLATTGCRSWRSACRPRPSTTTAARPATARSSPPTGRTSPRTSTTRFASRGTHPTEHHRSDPR